MNEQRSNEENRESSVEGNNEEQQASESPENTEKGQENNPIPNNPFIFSSQTRLEDMDESEWIDSVLVIVNVRLGMEKIANEYHSSIIALT